MGKNTMMFGDKVKAFVTRNRSVNPEWLHINGIYRLEHFRDGKLLGKYESHNLVTTAGKNYILDVVLHGTTQAVDWYVALVNNVNTKNSGNPVAPAITHVYDTFFDPAGDNTTNTEYINYTGGDTGSDRVHYVEAAASGGAITNTANKAAFTFTTGTGTLYGAVLVNVEAKSDHGTGVLMSYSAFTPGTIPVAVSDVVNVEIELAFT